MSLGHLGRGVPQGGRRRFCPSQGSRDRVPGADPEVHRVEPTQPVEEEAPRATEGNGERPAQEEVKTVPSQGVKYSEQRRRPDVIANTSANARFQALGPFWECLHVEAFLGPVRMIAVVDSGATVTTVTESVIMQAGLREKETAHRRQFLQYAKSR